MTQSNSHKPRARPKSVLRRKTFVVKEVNGALKVYDFDTNEEVHELSDSVGTVCVSGVAYHHHSPESRVWAISTGETQP